MYAVVRTGSKQHTVEKGERLKVERLAGDVGAELQLQDVLMVGGSGELRVGNPVLQGAVVTAKIVAQDKAPRVHTIKRRRRKGYRKHTGHRQPYTEIEITGIQG